MVFNELTTQDIKHKREIIRSSNQCNTRLYVVELLKDWSPEGFQRNLPQNNVDLSNKFRKGETVVIKLFVNGPEEERRADAKRRRDNELKRLRKLAQLEPDKNWFVMALGVGEYLQNSSICGPFVILEQGECSLGHLLHRRTDCRTHLNDQPLGSDPEVNSFYTQDHCFSFIVQIQGAVKFLHKQGMIHRDLKSYNVLLFNEKTLCKLCDFEDCRDINPRMTAKMGTTWWRAPELYLTIDSDGKTDYGFAADWFSFGLFMCELLFREEPFVCYYTGRMHEHRLDASKVFADKFLSTLPRFTEVDRRAMCIDHSTNPGQPRVLLNTDMCVFPALRDRKTAPKLWQLIDQLLDWNPKKRISADLSGRFDNDIRPFATGSPPPISLPDISQLTDTGAHSNETAMSWKPAGCVTKVHLIATDCDLDNDDVVSEVESRLQDRMVDIQGMIPSDPGVPSLRFKFYFKRPIERFVLAIEGEPACVKRTAEFCKTDSQFSDFLTGQFQFHPNPVVRGLKLKIKPKDRQGGMMTARSNQSV
ncbi:hypothetical protein BOX15_Mlig020798g1 [Macrostomum lignano]|uniref:Protein kinase domain-containing protein n=1 Tax=Macrostomum lignano TaxID=282301 RepID=A0A267E7I5_9PLAT|nr:hypothetical protein BOX15_Mlig020798g1 [Macrostomum lignano]